MKKQLIISTLLITSFLGAMEPEQPKKPEIKPVPSLLEQSTNAVAKNIRYLLATKPGIMAHLTNEEFAFGDLLKEQLKNYLSYKKILFPHGLTALVLLDPVNQIIAAGDEEGIIHIYDLQKQIMLKELSNEEYTGWLNSIGDIQTINADEIVASTSPGHIIKWNWKTEASDTIFKQTDSMLLRSVMKLCVINDKMIAGCYSGAKKIRIWDLHTKKCIEEIRSPDTVQQFRFFRDGVLFIVTKDSQILVYDFKNDECKRLDGNQLEESLHEHFNLGVDISSMCKTGITIRTPAGQQTLVDKDADGGRVKQVLKLDGHRVMALSQNDLHLRIFPIPETYSLKELLEQFKDQQEKGTVE